MKKVLIIAHFCSEFDGTGNNRFNYLADRLSSEEDIDIELMTSDFSHYNKKKRKKAEEYNVDYKLTFIEEPIYKKNVSIKRFYSHFIMAKNLKKVLNATKKPDVIYCAVPSLDIAYIASKFAKKYNIEFIIDIQDLWPEAFQLIFKIPIARDVLFYPMYRKAKKIYQAADSIIAVSETYLAKALKHSKRIEEKKAVFLGTDLELFDKLSFENFYPKKNKAEMWIAYAGTLGHSYDLTTVMDALKILNDNNIKNIRMIVMGDGPLQEKFELLANKYNLQVDFMGRLSYDKMVGILASCDIAVNPISKGAAQSIINKHGDYAAAGLPVINTQESEEYKQLVTNYSMGINCKNNDPSDLAEKLLFLVKNEDKRLEMSRNSRKLAEEKFDRKHTYQQIVNLLSK